MKSKARPAREPRSGTWRRVAGDRAHRRALRLGLWLARRERQWQRGGRVAFSGAPLRWHAPFQNDPFVAFVNEEPFYFQSAEMGSFVYAGRCRRRGEKINAMISAETIGYFSTQPGSQRYPALGLGLLYPRTGNFIGFVGNVASRSLLRDAIGEFRHQAQFPSQCAALPAIVPGSRLVRPLVILATRLPRHHGHRYRAVPLSVLPHVPRYPRQIGLRLDDSRRRGNGKSGPTLGQRFTLTPKCTKEGANRIKKYLKRIDIFPVG